MPLATPADYARMLDAASQGGYAYAAVNVTSSLTLNAALRGFAEAGADGIVEVTVGAGEFLSGTAVKDAAAGARAFAEFTRVVAADCPVLVALHTDHCPPPRVADFLEPLIAESEARVAAGGDPLFNSHMFDGSTLPLDENLEISAGLLERCAQVGVVLEVECGVVGGEEDGIAGPEGAREELYTTPADLLRVADALGTGDRGRYLLAATFGNVHGTYAPGHVHLRPEILATGQEALAAAHPGARFQYVFHGSSGSAREDVERAVEYGVVKTNVDSDAQHAFSAGVARHVVDHRDGILGDPPDKHAFDPRAWGRTGEEAMAAHVAGVCEVLGSAGRSLA
jgi:fructose-bisphosphate aldolase, class II